ncbi:MAG: hypothetical protein ACK4GQ_03575, partial [Candidatus Hadarchaeales archaeon]
MVSTKLDLCAAGGRAILLDSGSGWMIGRGSAVLENPSASLTFMDGVSVFRHGRSKIMYNGGPLLMLEEKLKEGYWAVGYIGYDFFRFLFPRFKTNPQKAGMKIPQAAFLLFPEGGFDGKPFSSIDGPSSTSVRPNSNITKSEFLSMVEKVRQYIARGD